MTPSIKGLQKTLSINDTQYNNDLPLCWVLLRWLSNFMYHYAGFHYAECHLSVIMLSVITLSVISLSVKYYILLCWMSLCRVSFWGMSLCWVLLCWVLWCLLCRKQLNMLDKFKLYKNNTYFLILVVLTIKSKIRQTSGFCKIEICLCLFKWPL